MTPPPSAKVLNGVLKYQGPVVTSPHRGAACLLVLQGYDLCRSLRGQASSQDSFRELGCRGRGKAAPGSAAGDGGRWQQEDSERIEGWERRRWRRKEKKQWKVRDRVGYGRQRHRKLVPQTYRYNDATWQTALLGWRPAQPPPLPLTVLGIPVTFPLLGPQFPGHSSTQHPSHSITAICS